MNEKTMNKKEFLMQIKNAVLEIEPDAEIRFYGSRTREDFTEQSDWDFLILLKGKVDDKRTDKIRHRLYEVEWEHGEVISSIVRNKKEWDATPLSSMPIHQVIEQEGIQL
jgi:predicted nucleotidyltransferase